MCGSIIVHYSITCSSNQDEDSIRHVSVVIGSLICLVLVNLVGFLFRMQVTKYCEHATWSR